VHLLVTLSALDWEHVSALESVHLSVMLSALEQVHQWVIPWAPKRVQQTVIRWATKTSV
jgi:hypothetical protein